MRSGKRCRRPGALAIWSALVAVAATIACRSDTLSLPDSFTATAVLRGASELPPNLSPATGAAVFTVAGESLTYTVTAASISTPLIVAHLYIGAAGTTGSILMSLPITAQAGVVATGAVDLTHDITYNTRTIAGGDVRAALSAGNCYINLVTAAFPGGELRGQLVRSESPLSQLRQPPVTVLAPVAPPP